MKSLLIASLVVFAGSALAQHCEDGGSCGMNKHASVASKDDEFMAEAHRMMLAAEGKDACGKADAHQAASKGEEGCGNAKGEPAKFKVFAMGKYRFFGCEGSAAKARQDLIAKGARAGKVQKVVGRAAS